MTVVVAMPGCAMPTGEPNQALGGLFFQHESVNHSEGEYVRDGVTTNSIESVFAVLKRGLIGVYHHASPKHLGRYVDEFAFENTEDFRRRDRQGFALSTEAEIRTGEETPAETA